MTRTRTALTLTTLGLAGLLGLTGCGVAGGGAAPAPAAPASGVTDPDRLADPAGLDGLAGLGDEAYALTAVGLRDDPAPSASAQPKERPGRARGYLRKNTLHGEVTVQGKDGVRTIAVQRGTITAVGADSVTVRSTDGVTWTWTFGDKMRVVRNRAAVETGSLKVGTEAGLAGRKDGDRTVARLIRLR